MELHWKVLAGILFKSCSCSCELLGTCEFSCDHRSIYAHVPLCFLPLTVCAVAYPGMGCGVDIGCTALRSRHASDTAADCSAGL